MKSWHVATWAAAAVRSVAVVVLVPFLLAGCGGGDDGSGANGQATATAGIPATAEATGMVRDGATQAPVEGAMVTLGGWSGVTGPDGRYDIAGIAAPGTYPLGCVASGWTAPGLPVPVQIVQGTNALEDILLVARNAVPPPPPPPSFGP